MRHFRISDQDPIKTKRLILTPLNAKQLAQLEDQEQDEADARGEGQQQEHHVERDAER